MVVRTERVLMHIAEQAGVIASVQAFTFECTLKHALLAASERESAKEGAYQNIAAHVLKNCERYLINTMVYLITTW